MVQNVFGICEAQNGTEANKLLQAGTDGHPRTWKSVEENSSPGEWWGSSKGGKKL